jgi:hypothetical protein
MVIAYPDGILEADEEPEPEEPGVPPAATLGA